MAKRKQKTWYSQVRNLLSDSDLDYMEIIPLGEDGAQVTLHDCSETYISITTFPSAGTLDQLRDSIEDMLDDLDDHECPEDD